VQLIGDKVEDVATVGLGGEAAVAVVAADLLEVVVQVAHRRLLRREGEGANGSASIAAICSRTDARRSNSSAVASDFCKQCKVRGLSVVGSFRSLSIRVLFIAYLPLLNVVEGAKKRPFRVVVVSNQSGKCCCSPGAP
jgi:hypothetical protein